MRFNTGQDDAGIYTQASSPEVAYNFLGFAALPPQLSHPSAHIQKLEICRNTKTAHDDDKEDKDKITAKMMQCKEVRRTQWNEKSDEAKPKMTLGGQ